MRLTEKYLLFRKDATNSYQRLGLEIQVERDETQRRGRRVLGFAQSLQPVVKIQIINYFMEENNHRE